MNDFSNRRPDAMQRTRRRYQKVRAPLPAAERAQLDRLVASLGLKAASAALGVDEATLARARTGGDLNSTTTAQLRSSGWIVTNPT